MKTLYSIIIAIALFTFSSCNKEQTKPGGSSIVSLEFDNKVSDTNLNLNTEDFAYSNDLGQQFKVTMLRYYISNIKLKKTDGTYYEDEVSDDGSKGYYLIDESISESQEINLSNVPAGEYEELSFTIGVDANRVTEGAQTGDLDPAKDMFWSWNAGYIFMRFEGLSLVSTETNNGVLYHVGGYKSDPDNEMLVNNIRERTIKISGGLEIEDGSAPQVHINVDLLEFFKGPNVIDFSSNASRHSPAACVEIADNYVDAFSIDHIHE